MPYYRDIKYFLHNTVCQNDYDIPGTINRLYKTLYGIDLLPYAMTYSGKIIYLGGFACVIALLDNLFSSSILSPMR